jgi:hypothetical protein
LRNLQDRLTQEKEAWQKEKDAEEKYVEEKKAELQRLQVRDLCRYMSSEHVRHAEVRRKVM